MAHTLEATALALSLYKGRLAAALGFVRANFGCHMKMNECTLFYTCDRACPAYYEGLTSSFVVYIIDCDLRALLLYSYLPCL